MEKKELEFGDKVNFVLLMMQAHCFCLIPFLRYKLGKDAFGLNALLAFVIQVVYIEATHDRYMGHYLAAWCVFVILQRLTADKAAHSLFEGYLLVARLLERVFGFIPSNGMARTIEALLVIAFGMMWMPDSAAFGKFFVCGGVTLLMAYRVNAFWMSRRLQQMRNQEMEMRILHEQYDVMKRRRP